jgi:hypothetical protein
MYFWATQLQHRWIMKRKLSKDIYREGIKRKKTKENPADKQERRKEVHGSTVEHQRGKVGHTELPTKV